MLPICHLNSYSTCVSELTGHPVYVNNADDQYLVSPDVSFAMVAEVSAQWVAQVASMRPESRPPPRLRKAVMDMASSKNRTELANALQVILVTEYHDKLESSSISGSQPFLIELMLSLWSCGAIAWPAKRQTPFRNPVLKLSNAGFSTQSLSCLKRIRDFLDRGSNDDSANFRFILDHILSRVAIAEIGDITPTTFYLSEARTRRGKLRSLGILSVLHLLREDHARAMEWTPEDFGFFQAKMGHLARDDGFAWLVSKDPAMTQWASLAIEHLERNPANFRKRKSAVNNFLKHYLEHPELPRNPAEYFDIRRRPTALYVFAGNKGRQTMAIVHQFLSDVLYKVCAQPDDNEVPFLMPGFSNPIQQPSYKNVNKGETHREAMPTRLISLAAHILTANNFAWAKEAGRLKDLFRSVNTDTGETETVWSPVRAYAILTKLLLPARTYQIRMLDSGEGDTFRYQANGLWETNTGPHHPTASGKPVEAGVFRRYKRKDGCDGSVFFFNTNKTADIDSVAQGYVMPWEKKDALQLLVELRDWQEKFNPVKTPTLWSSIIELKKTKHSEDLAKMGTNIFLFRDPANNTRPDLPVTDVRVRNFWLKLMEEMEIRLAKSRETLSNGDPIKLVLTRDKKTGQPTSATFDLHSLRVSIITAMYEEGVPPEYLMKIVGHATVLMTLYYTKLSAETLSLRMDEALLERQRKSQSEMVGFIKRASRQDLESAIAFRHPSALDAAVGGTGVGMLVMDHGICPVAAKRCSEGLALTDPSTAVTRYQSVPGGASNCTRCRFFLTGPAFLFGLEAHVNDLAYRLKKSSFTFEKSQEKFDALSDAHAASLCGGEPFHRQRELEIAETSFESATAEVDNIALSLQAAYTLTEQCVRIASDGKSDGLSLVVAGGTGQLEAVLSEGHEFDQLNRICMSATLFDGLNINWQLPNLERARLFDRMLRNSGIEPRFSLLNDEDALHAANAMGQFLYSRLDSNIVHDLVGGRTTLRAVGFEKAFVDKLDHIEPKTLNSARPRSILELP